MKLQKTYVAPLIDVLEVVMDNVLCTSGDNTPNVSTEDAIYNDFEW
jgi:hypothetical protein